MGIDDAPDRGLELTFARGPLEDLKRIGARFGSLHGFDPPVVT
jgi:hypothetical protein